MAHARSINKTLIKLQRQLRHLRLQAQAKALHRKYQTFTMIPRRIFAANLELYADYAPPTGCIVECGVWRGGMSAAMADLLPGRRHFLFDSFEGLPPAQAIDGQAALAYQIDKESSTYLDNCRAELSFADRAMKMSAAGQFELVRGWFNETLPNFAAPSLIAVLRLDGDWYESTMSCLQALYPQVMPGGLILIDDYYTWDGCSRAVHDYLSAQKSPDRIEQYRNVAHIRKRAAA